MLVNLDYLESSKSSFYNDLEYQSLMIIDKPYLIQQELIILKKSIYFRNF